MSKDNETVVFADGIGRTIIGLLDSETKTALTVKNPAILNVQPNPQTGQIQVQLIPFFFKEFVKGGNDADVSWEFLKTNVTRAHNVELDDRLKTQYKNMYSTVQAPDPSIITPSEASAEGNAPVVKLFDD